MLKTVSSVINAIGALNYKGTWNAATNTPTLTSGVGTKGDYYVVSVAGSTNLDGITTWGVGDWAVFNGTVWQKADGGSTADVTTLTVTSLTGYMYANNTSPVTASLTIPNAGLANSTATLGNTTVTLGSTTTSVGNLTLTNATISSLSTPITAGQGGTGLTTITLNNVILGNAANPVQVVAPGSSGNVLTSNGTTWISQAASASTGFPITVGNTSIAASSTTTDIGNLTLNNANVTSVAVTFPNSFLANSTATLGNTTITLGSTTTSVGNLTLNNVTVSSGNATVTTDNIGYANISTALRTQALTGYLYGNANTGNVTAATTIPNSGLANSTATLGNSTLTLGSTTTSVGNLTLQNTTIGSVATTFPNSFLANSTATLGNTTVTLGSTTTSVGNLTLNNVNIASGNTTVTTDNIGYANISTALRTQALTGYLYGNANTGNVTAATTIPNSGLANSTATLGNTTITLGSTTTSVGNLTTVNTTVTNYTESVVAIGNTGTTQTISLVNGTVQTATLTGNCTFTMPTATAGKSFILILNTGSSAFTATFTSVKWPTNTAPTITTGSATTKWDILTFVADGTNWYGNYAQAYQ